MSIAPRDSELLTLLRQPAVFLKRYRIALLCLLAAAAADAATTLHALRQFGVDSEIHLVQRFLVQFLGICAGVPVAKAVQIGFVIFVAAWWRPWCRWILVACAAFYALAAVSNYFVLL